MSKRLDEHIAWDHTDLVREFNEKIAEITKELERGPCGRP